MESIARYFVSIITAVILCGIFTSITDKSIFSKLIRFITGIIVTVAVFKPICFAAERDLVFRQNDIEDEVASAVTSGQDAAYQYMDTVINGRVCAYIEDKAASLGADLSASVTLREHIPSGATLYGNISPYARTQLTAWLTAELGIQKEDQRWG